MERGQVKVGDEVLIVGLQDEPKKTVVTGVEMFRKLLDYAEAGDNIGCLLREVLIVKKWNAARYCRNREAFILIRNSAAKYMF